MSTGTLLFLGAIAGLTIFLGLPLGRIQSPAPQLRAFLNAFAAGVLVFLLIDVANAANEHAIAQVLAPQIAQLATDYSHVFGPSTTFGKDLMPCVAASLGVAQVSDLMAVEGPYTFKRPVYERVVEAFRALAVPA